MTEKAGTSKFKKALLVLSCIVVAAAYLICLVWFPWMLKDLSIALVGCLILLALAVAAIDAVRQKPDVGLMILMVAIPIGLGIAFILFMPLALNWQGQYICERLSETGRRAKLAMDSYYSGGREAYTNRLSDLLKIDADLDGDPDLGWKFGDCNSSGYTFTIEHSQSGSFTIQTD